MEIVIENCTDNVSEIFLEKVSENVMEIFIEVASGIPEGGLVHADTIYRDAENSHPIEAITGLNETIESLLDDIRSLAGAATTLAGENTPFPIALAETILDFSTQFASTNPDVIETDDDANVIYLKAPGRYQFNTSATVEDADKKIITFRIRNFETGEIINDRPRSISGKGVVYLPMSYVPIAITEPTALQLSIFADGTGASLVAADTTLSSAASASAAPTSADKVSFNKTGTPLTADNVQAAIVEHVNSEDAHPANAANADLELHKEEDNPHNISKSTLQLDKVDNTSDAEKPVSIPQATELAKKVDVSSIIDNLTSALANQPLSANQGTVLKGLIDQLNILLTSDDTSLDELQEIVAYIKANRDTLSALSVSNIAGLQNALDTLTTAAAAADTKATNHIDNGDIHVTAAEKAAIVIVPNTRTESAAFSIATGDEEGLIEYTGTAAVNVTVYNTLKLNSVVSILQDNTGVVTIVGDTGMTVKGLTKSAEQNALIQVKKIADNVILVIGGVA